MKNIIFLVVTSILTLSCSLPDNQTTTIDVVPVSSVDMPTQFAKDSITKIPITYVRPTNCHVFSDFYYYVNENTRTVAIYCAKLNQSNCTENNLPSTVDLPFKPGYTGTYHFKFFKGTNQDNIDEFFEYDALVDH
jgi:hypothetical protein